MEIFALFDCIITPACLISQTAGGLKIGMLLFLVASGLTLVFGVLGVINFAHGALYMLGAYFSWQVMSLTGHKSERTLASYINYKDNRKQIKVSKERKGR